jgi:hypothetical protein
MTAAAVLALLIAEAVAPATAAAEETCAAPAGERAPDLRCGETLDGRVPAEPSTGRQVARAALVVPRLATQAVFWPIVKTTDYLEYHHVVDWARVLLTTDDGLVGVRPELQYSTSFLPTGGARFFYRRLPGPGSELMTRFRTAGPAAMLGQIGARGPDWLGLTLLATWNLRQDRLFAGVGPNTDEDLAIAGQGRARYGSNALGAELLWSRRLPGRLVAQARGGLDRRDYRSSDVVGGPSVAEVFGLPADTCAARGLPDPCVDETQMPGFYRGLRIARAGGGLILDLRNPARDGGGFTLAADATFAQGLAGDPSRHATYAAETVAGIGGNDRLFLVRARAKMVERLGAAPIPFEELVVPSGMIDMRGFPDGRLRDASGLVGSAEYRWYISAYLDATLFVDVGTVAGPRFAGFDGTRWFPSYGLGFRYYQPQGAHWEARAVDGIQIAYAPEGGLRLLLTMAAF